MTQLEAVHAAACQYVEAVMTVQGEMAPVLFVPVGNDLARVSAPWRNQAHKEIIVKAWREVLSERDIACYSFATEAYAATVNMRTQAELVDVLPSQRSDREDVVFISSRSRDGKTLTTKYVVDYLPQTDDRPKIKLSQPEDLNEFGQSMEGLLANLFEDE